MSEEQAQQFLYQMQMLESIASSLEQKEAAIVNFLREAMASIESIKNLSGGQEVESLVPLGLGAYAKANIANNSKILMDIGAGIAVEKDHDSAMNYLETRIKELQVALNETSSQKQQAMMQLEQMKDQMNQMMQQESPKQ
ncbi:MAG TPA: prefoldin subunit alpha [Candidatus Nitrosotenuis sp.]|nr:prefoldin subunit alpha [Candidatus Nitrosotenuis sp.]